MFDSIPFLILKSSFKSMRSALWFFFIRKLTHVTFKINLPKKGLWKIDTTAASPLRFVVHAVVWFLGDSTNCCHRQSKHDNVGDGNQFECKSNDDCLEEMRLDGNDRKRARAPLARKWHALRFVRGDQQNDFHLIVQQRTTSHPPTHRHTLIKTKTTRLWSKWCSGLEFGSKKKTKSWKLGLKSNEMRSSARIKFNDES